MLDDPREDDLRYAARQKGYVLIRTGNTFALAILSGANLDDIERFLGTDGRHERTGAERYEQAEARK
jgi:hypothetical protein